MASRSVTDSAAGATAFSCGMKSYNGAIAVEPVGRNPCGTVLEAAKHKGYKTGLIVTSVSTRGRPATVGPSPASPGSAVLTMFKRLPSSESRTPLPQHSMHTSPIETWRTRLQVSRESRGQKARPPTSETMPQGVRWHFFLLLKMIPSSTEHLVGLHPLGQQVDLAFGGGLCFFLPNSSSASCRTDDLDLISAAESKKNKDPKLKVITTRQEFDLLEDDSSALGTIALLAQDHMEYEIDRVAMTEPKQPSLSEM